MNYDVDDVDAVANAKYVMLSLLRELHNLQRKDENNQEYLRQIAQLENDYEYYNDKKMLKKVKDVYEPYLKSLLEENYE